MILAQTELHRQGRQENEMLRMDSKYLVLQVLRVLNVFLQHLVLRLVPLAHHVQLGPTGRAQQAVFFAGPRQQIDASEGPPTIHIQPPESACNLQQA